MDQVVPGHTKVELLGTAHEGHECGSSSPFIFFYLIFTLSRPRTAEEEQRLRQKLAGLRTMTNLYEV